MNTTLRRFLSYLGLAAEPDGKAGGGQAGLWGKSIITHPEYVREQQERTARLRAAVDYAYRYAAERKKQ